MNGGKDNSKRFRDNLLRFNSLYYGNRLSLSKGEVEQLTQKLGEINALYKCLMNVNDKLVEIINSALLNTRQAVSGMHTLIQGVGQTSKEACEIKIKKILSMIYDELANMSKENKDVETKIDDLQKKMKNPQTTRTQSGGPAFKKRGELFSMSRDRGNDEIYRGNLRHSNSNNTQNSLHHNSVLSNDDVKKWSQQLSERTSFCRKINQVNNELVGIVERYCQIRYGARSSLQEKIDILLHYEADNAESTDALLMVLPHLIEIQLGNYDVITQVNSLQRKKEREQLKIRQVGSCAFKNIDTWF